MVCQNCSSPISPDTHFCPSCGTPTEKPSSYLAQKPGINLIHENKAPSNNTRLLEIGAAFFLFGIFAFLFVVLPRISNANFLKDVQQQLAETSTKTGKVNQSLEAIYNYVTKSLTETTESALPAGLVTHPENLNVAGVSTADEFQWTNAPTLYDLKEVFVKPSVELQEKKVKAFTTGDKDPLKVYRDLRDLANNAEHSSQEGLDSLKIFASSVKERSSSASPRISTALTKINSQTEKYLLEAAKTADYYQTYTDSYVDLTSVITDSLNATNINQIDSNLLTAKKIQRNLSNLANLPEAIENFHQDVLREVGGAVAFLDTITSLVKSNDPAATAKADVAAKKWLADEQALVSRLQTNQTNFWKKNETLNSYQFLSAAHGEALKKIDQEKASEKVFFVF